MAKKTKAKDGNTVYLIETESDIQNIQSSNGYFGRKPQIGYYYMYLGVNDGGYVIYEPSEVV